LLDSHISARLLASGLDALALQHVRVLLSHAFAVFQALIKDQSALFFFVVSGETYAFLKALVDFCRCGFAESENCSGFMASHSCFAVLFDSHISARLLASCFDALAL